ncbi:MAG: HpcH/HpaI aldolase family protein [Alphaproteobacteria bacterium]
MRENGLKTLWQDGKSAVNGWLGIPSSVSAEVMAHAGWDSLTIDLQHGLVDYQTAVTMLQAISTTDVVPMVRVPWLDPALIMKSLDAGAYGVICPMIGTRAQAAELVSYCRYAPTGTRSFGPARAMIYGGPDYPEKADETVLAIAMIETAEAMDNLEEIISTPGLDAVYIGPSDLSLALGQPPRQDWPDGPVFEAQKRILAVAKQHGVAAGIHNVTAQYALRMIKLGFDLVTIASDSRLLGAKAAAEIATVREGL